MAHNIKAKELVYDHYALFARLKSTVFSSRLKAVWLVISWSDVGSEFTLQDRQMQALLAQLESSCRLFISSTALRTKSGTRGDARGRRGQFRHIRRTTSGMNEVHKSTQFEQFECHALLDRKSVQLVGSRRHVIMRTKTTAQSRGSILNALQWSNGRLR